MEMISERSNKGKEKLIEDDDHCPSQNNLPGSDHQQQNFGGGRGAAEPAVSAVSAITAVSAVSTISAAADGASFSHSASEKKRTELLPLSDFVDHDSNPHRLQWTEELHNRFVRAREELVRCGKKVTPKTLTKAMAIDGLTQQHVKSRLQRLREGRITKTNWQAPRGPRRKNNKAGKIDGRKSASKSASTSSREHERNGPGMGDQNVAVTAQQQPHHDFNQNKSPELDERSRTVSAGHQQPSQVDVADISAANGFSIPGPYNIPTTNTAINNVQVGLQEQTPDFQAQWLLPAQYGVGLQMQTPGFQNHNGFYYNFHQPGNEAQWLLPAQYGVGLQMQTPGFQNHNGFYYNFHQPGNEAHWFHPAQYGVGLHMQTPGFQNHNGFFYNFHPGNEAHWPAICGVGLQMQTSGFQNHNVFDYNLQPGNEAHWFQPAIYGVGLQMQTHRIQQPAHDGGAFGNIQQQNQPQAATDTVQAQKATAITPDNMVTTEDLVEDFLNLDSSELGIADFEIDFELARVVQPAEDGVPRLYNQNEVYNIHEGNETHIVQQPAQDGGALGNIQQQNQPQAATDTVQAQNATAITPDNMVTTEDPTEYYFNLDNSELGIADFDFSEPFGFGGLPL